MSKKIMVVDDNPSVTYSVKNAIETMNKDYTVLTADSGEKCLDLLKQNKKIDAIILDIMMPGMSGWETYDKLKENETWSKIPVIFLTARTDRVAENAGKFLGEDYIEKPFEMNDLKYRIEKIINKLQ
jgi:CheY-like chemotaxis protein